jgi:thiol-disulfide isomerase/thioredoxin
VNEKDTGSARTWLAIAVTFVALWVLYLAFFGPRSPSPSREDPGAGEQADYDWSFSDLQDRPETLARFKGKAVFLNIWATWCPPCVREMPSIARLAEDPRLAGKDIAFVCVSIDESTDEVRKFLEGKGWKMSFFRSQKIPRVFATDGIPATFIIAPDGRIASAQIGATEWDNPETIGLLEKLDAEASPR